jgi:hypothetical protein
LHLESFGMHSFLAVDADARLAVGFVTERMVNETGFEEFFVARLVSATASAMEGTQ